jgi:hypothetical protein
MGDRCNLTLTYAKADEKKFEKELGMDLVTCIEKEGEAWRTILLEQINYGLWTEREEWAKQGLCFFGTYDAGCGYPASGFAAVDGKHADVPMCQGELLVFLNHKGRVLAHSMRAAQKYLRLAAKARKRLGVPDDE